MALLACLAATFLASPVQAQDAGLPNITTEFWLRLDTDRGCPSVRPVEWLEVTSPCFLEGNGARVTGHLGLRIGGTPKAAAAMPPGLSAESLPLDLQSAHLVEKNAAPRQGLSIRHQLQAGEPVTLSRGEWTHVAVTLERRPGAPMLVVYLDGVKHPSTMYPGFLFHSEARHSMGRAWISPEDAREACAAELPSCSISTEGWTLGPVRTVQYVRTPAQLAATMGTHEQLGEIDHASESAQLNQPAPTRTATLTDAQRREKMRELMGRRGSAFKWVAGSLCFIAFALVASLVAYVLLRRQRQPGGG